MFRARDSCGADVRRGRSPKCLFIKATATGNTINGLNDEINKPSEAGHGGAQPGLRWPGRCCWAEPQTCLQARALSGPSHPACPPNTGPAPVPPPPHASPCPVLTQGHVVHTAAPPRHSPRCATPARAGPSPLPRWAFLWGPSPPPKPPQMYQDGAGLGVYFFIAIEGQTWASSLPGSGPGALWKCHRAGISPCSPPPGTLSDSQFQESCIFLG